MDSLAANGVRFERSYCTAPVCGPARSSLITSRMPHTTGAEVSGQTPDPANPNMGEVFRQAGYTTAWAGKWHLSESYPREGIAGLEYLHVPADTKFRLGSQTDGPAADETVPLVVGWKGVTLAGRCDRTHLVSGLDVLPTMCDYAGIGLGGDFEGMSLRPLIETPGRPGREFLVTKLQSHSQDLSRKGHMLRTARYKYIVFSHGRNREMLFDLEEDPGETVNLALHPSSKPNLEHHRSLLHAWIVRTGDHFQGV